jgi:TatD DNase family protein
MFYDIHSHLSSEEFDKDREAIINDCGKNNIIIFDNGLGYETNKKVLELSNKFPNVKACLGMYPGYEFDERVISQIRNNKEKIVGIGEVGLDSNKGLSGFKKMISLAEELNKPLIVHSRDSQIKVLELIKDVKVPVVLHAFLTSKRNVRAANKLNNVYFSILANIVYNEQMQLLAENVSINKLLCETDSPVLWKSGRNTPLNVTRAYEKIAEIKGVSLKQVEYLIELNVKRVFHRI